MKPRRNTVRPAVTTIIGPHGPIPIRRYEPQHPVSTVPIVWVHGGAFMQGTLDLPETHEVALALAERGIPVIAMTYRLARYPRVRYPVPLDDVVAVVREVQREYPNGVILGGASAGACLSAATVLRLAADGEAPLRGIFFAYGLFHARLPRRSPELMSRLRGYRRYAHNPAGYALMTAHYAGIRVGMSQPFAFPGGHDVSGFPPTLLVDADHDAMRASGGQFGRELEQAGVDTEYHVIPDVDHAFLNRPDDPGFTAAIALIADWARRR